MLLTSPARIAESASAGRPMQLRSGELAAPAARCLPLLPSGPGGVHRATMRETRSSTPHEPSGAHLCGGLRRPKSYACAAATSLLAVRPRRPGPARWRRGRDSNPGWSYPHTRSPGVLLQPLGHLSAFQQETSSRNDIRRADPPTPLGRARARGGEGGIRTHVGVAPQPAFEAGPLRPLRYLSVSAEAERLAASAPRQSA